MKGLKRKLLNSFMEELRDVYRDQTNERAPYEFVYQYTTIGIKIYRDPESLYTYCEIHVNNDLLFTVAEYTSDVVFFENVYHLLKQYFKP